MTLIDSYRALTNVAREAKSGDREYWFNSSFSQEILSKVLKSEFSDKTLEALNSYPTIDLCCGDVSSVNELMKTLKTVSYFEYVGDDKNTIRMQSPYEYGSQVNFPISTHLLDDFFKMRSYQDPNCDYVINTKKHMQEYKEELLKNYDSSKMSFFNDDALLFLGLLPDKSVNIILGGLENNTIIASNKDTYHRYLAKEIERVLAPGAFFMDVVNMYDFDISDTIKISILPEEDRQGYLHQSTKEITSGESFSQLIKKQEQKYQKASKALSIYTGEYNYGRIRYYNTEIDLAKVIASSLSNETLTFLEKLTDHNIKISYDNRTNSSNISKQVLEEYCDFMQQATLDLNEISSYASTLPKIDDVLEILNEKKYYTSNQFMEQLKNVSSSDFSKKYELIKNNGLAREIDDPLMLLSKKEIEDIVEVVSVLKKFSDFKPTYHKNKLYLEMFNEKDYLVLDTMSNKYRTLESVYNTSIAKKNERILDLTIAYTEDDLPF